MGLRMHCVVTRKLMSPPFFHSFPNSICPISSAGCSFPRPSQSWTELFASSLTVVSPSLPRRCTSQANMLHLVLQPVFRESLTNFSHMMICLKRSKTNPFEAGFTLHFDRTGNEEHLAITTSPLFIYQRVR